VFARRRYPIADIAPAVAAGRHFTLDQQGPTVYRGIGEIDVWRSGG